MAEHNYLVKDPQGVYEDQAVTLDYGIPITEAAARPLSIGMAKAIAVKVLAIEKMYGCPLDQVCAKHVVDMLRSVTLERVDEAHTARPMRRETASGQRQNRTRRSRG